VTLEQNLDGQIAAQVRVSTFEHYPHAAAGNFSEKLDSNTTLGRRWHFGR
jgi:hypothetical protein